MNYNKSSSTSGWNNILKKKKKTYISGGKNYEIVQTFLPMLTNRSTTSWEIHSNTENFIHFMQQNAYAKSNAITVAAFVMNLAFSMLFSKMLRQTFHAQTKLNGYNQRERHFSPCSNIDLEFLQFREYTVQFVFSVDSF